MQITVKAQESVSSVVASVMGTVVCRRMKSLVGQSCDDASSCLLLGNDSDPKFFYVDARAYAVDESGSSVQKIICDGHQKESLMMGNLLTQSGEASATYVESDTVTI